MDESPAPPSPPRNHVVEEARRLSESFIWRLPQAFYAAEGVNAWASGTVPWFVTSNTLVARAYARMIDA